MDSAHCVCPVLRSCSRYNRLGELKITRVISNVLHPTDEGGISRHILTHCNSETMNIGHVILDSSYHIREGLSGSTAGSMHTVGVEVNGVGLL